MTQEQVGLERRIERRRAPRYVVDHAVLSPMVGVMEGIAGALVVLTASLGYHALAGTPFPEFDLALYGLYALLVGGLYGGYSAVTASRYLNRTLRPHATLSDSALGWTGATALALLFSFIVGLAGELSRVSLTVAYLAGLPLLLGLRGAIYTSIRGRVENGRLQYQKVAVVGTRADVARFLVRGQLWRSGFQLAGSLYLDDEDLSGLPRRESMADLALQWLARDIDYVVLVGDIGDLDEIEMLTEDLKRFAVDVICAPATDNVEVKFLDVIPMGANNALKVLGRPLSDADVLLKRAFDVSGALAGLLLLSPLFLLVALAIKLDSPGPVFYRQARRGFNGKTFHIWKFRSMTVTESGTNMQQARRNDPRITRVGRFIRAHSIDELPQLINVLLGSMSLVGPRPHALAHDDELGEQLASYAYRRRIKPGITGWAQVNGYRGETSTFEQIEGRTRHDLHYIEHWSIFLDVWIILLTVFSRKVRENAG